jgi:hypothetical protein
MVDDRVKRVHNMTMAWGPAPRIGPVPRSRPLAGHIDPQGREGLSRL